ncbi:MAG: PEP-CTERM sorting domain-containing protein [Bryobacteraceae bacterium]
MTNDLTSDSPGCFMFGNPFAQLGADCGVAIVGPAPNPGALFFDTSGDLPSTPGIYPGIFGGLFKTPAVVEQITYGAPTTTTGAMSLTITEVPEPSTLGPVMIGLWSFVLYGVTVFSASPRKIAPAA